MAWHHLCPKIKKKLDKLTEISSKCTVHSAVNGIFKVTTGEYERSYIVDIKAKICDYKRWQLTGIPCHHAIACCMNDRISPETLVHKCYSIDTYKKAYAHTLVPLRGRCFWEKMNGVTVHPPLFTKVMGRPKKNRKKTPEEKEKEGAKFVTRSGTTMHCSVCGKPDHNKKGHDKYMMLRSVGIDEDNQDIDVDNPTILEVSKFYYSTFTKSNYFSVLNKSCHLHFFSIYLFNIQILSWILAIKQI
jgi:hypothetical protein